MVSSTLTVKAKAWKDGLAASATAVAGFTREAEATPKLVAGLRLWWRADAGVPSGEGDYWADQSGQGNHGTQTNGAAVPRLVPNVANGLPVMRFDGGDTVRFTTRLTTIRTVFWVVSTAEVAAGRTASRSLLGDDSAVVRVARGLRRAGDDLGRATRRPAVRDGLTCGERGGGAGDDDAAADVSVGGVGGDDGERVRAEVRGGDTARSPGWGTWRS